VALHLLEKDLEFTLLHGGAERRDDDERLGYTVKSSMGIVRESWNRACHIVRHSRL
jgi:hypothetical protein